MFIEQDAALQLAKLNVIVQILQDIKTNTDKIFTVIINGVNYIGQIQSIEPTISCQTGTGYVERFCGKSFLLNSKNFSSKILFTIYL